MNLTQRGDRCPGPVPPGTMGTIRSVHPHGVGHDAWLQVEVDWDTGRKLMLMVPPDWFEVVPKAAIDALAQILD